MDSRDYICPFTIGSLADVPADFEMPPGLSASIFGVFLPQSDPDWLGRSAYPPNAILVDHDRLFVIPHPHAAAPSVCQPLSELESIECGRMLLLGWIRLRWRGGEQLLSYNRRSAATVEEFLARLRARWLVTRSSLERPRRFHFGAPLNGKFAHAVSTEVSDEGEIQIVRFHQPAVRITRRRIFRFETWWGGDLILLTDRRLLWITERHGSYYAAYGTVSRNAPIQMIAEVRIALPDAGPRVEIVLRSGETWSVAVRQGYEHDAAALAELATDLFRIDGTAHGSRVAAQDALVEHL